MILTQTVEPANFVPNNFGEMQDKLALLDILSISESEVLRGEIYKSQDVFQHIRSRLNAKKNAGTL